MEYCDYQYNFKFKADKGNEEERLLKGSSFIDLNAGRKNPDERRKGELTIL